MLLIETEMPNHHLHSVMMAVEELAASEGTQHWVDGVIHYVMSTDRRQRVTLHNTQHQLL